MEIRKGMVFRGNQNGREIEILDANPDYVQYRDIKHGTVFLIGRKTFERCDLTLEALQD